MNLQAEVISQKISPADLPGMSNRELVFIHAQLHKFWQNHFAGNTLESSDGSSREDIVNSEVFLEEEMQTRGISHAQQDELDRTAAAFAGRVKIVSNVKIAETEDFSLVLWPSCEAYKINRSDIVLVPDFISEVGGSLEHPGDANDLDFVVRMAQSDVTRSLLEGIYLLLRKKFDPEKRGIVHVLPAPEGPHGNYKPVYDLVMRPKAETGEKFNPQHDPRSGEFAHGSWGGTVRGGTEVQRKSVRDAMGQIPPEILPDNLTVRIGSLPVGLSERTEGVYQGPAAFPTPRHVITIKPSVFQEPPHIRDYVILHEAGHAVQFGGKGLKVGIDNDRIRAAWGDFKKSPDSYAKKDPDEGFAVGFAARISNGTKFGTKSENIFTKLGV